MRTSNNVVAEMTMTLTVQEAKTLRKLLAQITQGIAPALEHSEIETIKIFNREVGDFVDKCKQVATG